MSGLALRCAPSVAALMVFAAMALLYQDERARWIYFSALEFWGIKPHIFPYLDFAGYLSSLECTRLGVDVIAVNSCDPLDRQFNYGPLWLDLTFLPLYPPDRVVGGTVLNLFFIGSFALLAPPRGGWELSARILAATSSAVVFAVERANPDILIYILVTAVVVLVTRGVVARVWAYALIWFMAGLKFYPMVLMGLASRERPRWFWGLLGASVGLVGLYLVVYHVSLGRILPLLPAGNYNSDLFAAKNLPMQLGLVVRAGVSPIAGVIVGVAVVLGLLWRLTRHVRRLLDMPALGVGLAALPVATGLQLLAGALLIVGCFFAGQSIAYRAIFLLLTMPGLYAMGEAAQSPALRRICRKALWVAVFLLWEEAIRLGLDRGVAALGMGDGGGFLAGLMFWVFRELIWWWMVAVLLAVVLRFAWVSPVWMRIRLRREAC